MTPEQVFATLTAPRWTRISQSAGGRPLWIRKWSGAGQGAPILFHGAIHGDEPLGAYCLVKLAEELDAGLDAAALTLTRDLVFFPVVNPDGYLAGKKNNGSDVDLNRNFPAQNWQPELGPGYFPGTRGGSETETQALVRLIEDHGFTRIITLHSPFRMVNYDGPARALAERMSAKNGYPVTADMGYPTPGSFGTMYGVERNLEIITLEIPPMTPAEAYLENRDALLAALT